MVDEDELRKSLRVLSKQKSAGVSTVSNTMLRRVFVDGKADTVATVLLPFARMCTSGCVCQDAMQLLLASRLALVPKCDASAPPPQPGQPAPVQDYRPLGVGDTLVRLISTSLMTQEGKAVGKKLAPQQLAVSVSDGCAIITSALQCLYDHGRAGREGCDFLLMDMKNAY
jgi:hypothetical protein